MPAYFAGWRKRRENRIYLENLESTTLSCQLERDAHFSPIERKGRIKLYKNTFSPNIKTELYILTAFERFIAVWKITRVVIKLNYRFCLLLVYTFVASIEYRFFILMNLCGQAQFFLLRARRITAYCFTEIDEQDTHIWVLRQHDFSGMR